MCQALARALPSSPTRRVGSGPAKFRQGNWFRLVSDDFVGCGNQLRKTDCSPSYLACDPRYSRKLMSRFAHKPRVIAPRTYESRRQGKFRVTIGDPDSFSICDAVST